MAFPESILDTQVELFIGGAWSDITSDVYSRDPITISRGRTAEGTAVDPGRCTLTLNNRDGKYSPRNPMSPLFGLIGRNTPIRVSVNVGSPHLGVPADAGDNATTPDSAALNVTDLDVRIEAAYDDWSAPANDPLELVGKFHPGGNCSWMLTLWHGGMVLYWSPDGTTQILKISTAHVMPPPSGRMAVRATLDVDNGSSGATVMFYTAPSIDGPWTPLGDPVVAAGTTSIFDGTAPLQVGDISLASFKAATGRVYRVEVRDGIDGTVVANPDFTAQTVSGTSFTDGAGTTWAFSGNSSITNQKIRFVGEVSAWPIEWDTSGRDIYVSIQAAGILRRLSQGTQALDSTLRRRIPTDPSLLAYWPMEDGENAVQASSPIAGVNPMPVTFFGFASVDTLPGSSALPALNANTGKGLPLMSGEVPAPSPASTEWRVEFVYRLDEPSTTLYTFMRILTTGTARDFYLQMNSTLARIITHDKNGDVLFTKDIDISGAPPFGAWYRLIFYCKQNGSNVDYVIVWVLIGVTAGQLSGSFTGTVGQVTSVASPPDGYAAALDGMGIGHIAVFSDADTNIFNLADRGFNQETAGVRMLRLAGEEGTPIAVVGDTDAMVELGPQRPETLLALVQDSADADHGILMETREAVGLTYLGRATMYNQIPTQLAYGTDLMPPLTPVDDDQGVQNDVTVTRVGGSSARVVQTEGPLSVSSPPNGIGSYPTSQTLNLYEDAQTEQHASFLVQHGTVDEARYPVVNLSMARNPELIDKVTALDSGQRLQILDPPTKLPPGTIDLLVQGYKESIGQYTWDVVLNCTPGSPWTVGLVGDPGVGRADTAGSELAAAVASTATTLSVSTTDGPVWTTDLTDLPMDVVVGGEVMTVTAISGTASPQTFTVTRSVNGIAKAQTAGTDLRLATPTIVAL